VWPMCAPGSAVYLYLPLVLRSDGTLSHPNSVGYLMFPESAVATLLI
jgi:hypothetical protein